MTHKELAKLLDQVVEKTSKLPTDERFLKEASGYELLAYYASISKSDKDLVQKFIEATKARLNTL